MKKLSIAIAIAVCVPASILSLAFTSGAETGGTDYKSAIGLTGIWPLKFFTNNYPPSACTTARAGQIIRVPTPSGIAELLYCSGTEWRYMTPGFAFSAYTGRGIGGAGPANGIDFAEITPRDPTYGTVVLMSFLVQDPGSGVGNATIEIYQNVTILCAVTLPCTTAVGVSTRTFPCPANVFSPYGINGDVRARFANSSVCTKNPIGFIQVQYEIGPRFP